jgi:hypothetical protein
MLLSIIIKFAWLFIRLADEEMPQEVRCNKAFTVEGRLGYVGE